MIHWYHLSQNYLFKLFIVLIFMLFVEVYYTIIIFSYWIIRTTIIFVGITFVVYLMLKRWRFLFITNFFYISYSILFCHFPRVDWFSNSLFSNNQSFWSFFFKFLQGIKRFSIFILSKSSPCPDKREKISLSFRISISVGFSILVILLDYLVLRVDLDLSIELSVSGFLEGR